MEIKFGEYVRNRDGIGKVVEVTDNYCRKDNGYKVWFVSNKDLKHSPNIIDLIEVGDYVNGSKVIDIAQAETKAIFIEDIKQKLALIPIINKDIKSIITKEQFSSIEYKI